MTKDNDNKKSSWNKTYDKKALDFIWARKGGLDATKCMPVSIHEAIKKHWPDRGIKQTSGVSSKIWPVYAKTGRDGCKNAARLVGTVPKLSKKGEHNYKTATECRDGPGRLQNCSETGRNGVVMKQKRQA